MAYVIKRYSNRKLYDTQESRYVTLEELEELIRAGREISVVDVSTGEDLTSVTLAQIILENERNHRATLPTAFLHQLIKHGEAWLRIESGRLRVGSLATAGYGVAFDPDLDAMIPLERWTFDSLEMGDSLERGDSLETGSAGRAG